ncbi:uncharacterized protein LOC143785026 [Ranitomeya variabilis]|uniref:uncharacterized protein LOC143785026 n=1 Tax=Ranitomeya variabilis TaxID=490064 RepID=UPI004056F952
MLLLLMAAMLLHGSESQRDLTAQIHMIGIAGTISITTDTRIVHTNLTGTCGSVHISIHEFPVVYGASRDPCDEKIIGSSQYNLTMPGAGQMVINGKMRWDGRSLALQSCGLRTCANLLGESQRTWQAKLHSFIIGQAIFLQSLADDTILAVLDLAMLEEIPTSNASVLFSSSCRIDAAHIFGSVRLGSGQEFIKSRIELNDVTMMPFLLVKYNEQWVCAEIRNLTPKVSSAPISMLGVNGSFTFRQQSPFHPTHVSVKLWGLLGRTVNYGIHSLPILPWQIPKQDVCTTASIGNLWNPLDINSQFTSASSGHNSWPMGNLSGRHGTIQGQDKVMDSLVDQNLPMFGYHSILGRSVVLSEMGGKACACGTIQPEGEALRAMVVFRKGVMGRVMFQQALNDPYGDLSIYVELSHGSDSASRGHNWHIHNNPLLTESEICANAGGHFNPYNVPVNQNYSNQCRSQHPLRCEAGDYASKHRPISFYTSSPARYVFTDTSSSLGGSNSIIGRSLVVHGANGTTTRVACANVLLQHIKEARTGAWFGGGNAQGELQASQASEFDPTSVQISFSGLQNLAGGFHIHLLPVNGALNNPCSSALIRGHFNPFGIDMSTSPPAGNGTDDEYEVGDISGRRGSLHDQENVTKQYTDMNFPLSGPHSILGRSLVIHYSNGSRMQCTSFLQELSSDGEWVRASAEFSGNISGRISLRQAVYPDGASGETTILVDLQLPLISGKTLEWLIHSAERRGEPYNPFDVPIQAGNWCTVHNPQLCTVGDLKGKHGPVVAGDTVLVTDPNLPLAGDFTVLGRSLTVTSDAVELTSVILPDVPITSLYFQRMTSFNRSAFREALSLILNVAPWKVTLLPDSPDSVTTCQRVEFFVIGFNDTEALSSIQAVESLGPPCRTPSGSIDSSADSEKRMMKTSFLMVSLFLLLW